jgi:hypothetical protein
MKPEHGHPYGCFLAARAETAEQGKTEDYFRGMRELDERQLRLNDARAALFARYVGPDDGAGTSQVPPRPLPRAHASG